jgi:hypothetical protein
MMVAVVVAATNHQAVVGVLTPAAMVRLSDPLDHKPQAKR